MNGHVWRKTVYWENLKIHTFKNIYIRFKIAPYHFSLLRSCMHKDMNNNFQKCEI